MALPEVKELPINGRRSQYRVGDMTFDEEDKSLPYIDARMAEWLAFRNYVVAENEAVAVVSRV